MGAGVPGATAFVRNLATTPSGDVVVLRWNGGSWAQEAPVPALGLRKLAFDGSGRLIAVGLPTGISSPHVGSVAVWDGVAWSEYGPSPSGAVSVALSTAGGLVVGGDFVVDAGTGARNIAVWHALSGTWQSFTPPAFDSEVFAAVELANGDVIVGGSFPGVVARWNAGSWTPLPGLPFPAWCLAVLEDGTTVAGGDFTGRVVRPGSRSPVS